MTNTQADRVKEVARLAGRPSRLRRREFLAEGPQAVREALRLHLERGDAGRPGVVVDVYATQDALERHQDITELLARDGAPDVRRVNPDVLAAMSSTVTPQGFIAVCTFVDVALDDVLAAAPRLVAVLVEVRDPGNAGTIIRAADSAGADAVILTGGSVDPYNPKTVRSTVGSLFHLPLVMGVELEGLIGKLRSAGMTVLAADGYGATSLDDLQDASAARRFGAVQDDVLNSAQGAAKDTAKDTARDTAKDTARDSTEGHEPDQQIAGQPTGPEAVAGAAAPGGLQLESASAWLFGNEAQGLPGEVTAAADARVAVPIYGRAESLNVGTAATVCLYASARAQRLR